jgi:hypothetical protein
MDTSKMTKTQLLDKCKELKLKIVIQKVNQN